MLQNVLPTTTRHKNINTPSGIDQLKFLLQQQHCSRKTYSSCDEGDDENVSTMINNITISKYELVVICQIVPELVVLGNRFPDDPAVLVLGEQNLAFKLPTRLQRPDLHLVRA